MITGITLYYTERKQRNRITITVVVLQVTRWLCRSLTCTLNVTDFGCLMWNKVSTFNLHLYHDCDEHRYARS